MHLVLDTKGINLKVRNACFHLQTEKHERLISPMKISSISITSICWISSSAIRLAVQHRIPIYFHDGFGNVEGRLWSASFGHLATNRRKQVLFSLDVASTKWIIEVFNHKTEEQTQNLIFLKTRKVAQSLFLDESINRMKAWVETLKPFADQTLTNCSASIMGKEGTIARYYWQAISKCMPKEMQFDDRNRRPAQDNYNAATNYLYGMLYGTVENALFIAGLDPYLGLLHADEYNQPTLAFDLIEPFRPWVDRLLIESILKNEIKPNFFEPKNGGVWLSKVGKQYFIPIFDSYFESKADFRGKTLSRNAHIYRLAADLCKLIQTQ
jgi:CRISPR-associated protein Cas1